jgi:hypothetical protein
MIPIKDAITIFEQHKINYIMDNNPGLADYSFGKEPQTYYLENKASGKDLLSFIKKKHINDIDGVNYINSENTIFGDLQLYGKEYKREIARLTDPLLYSLDARYEEIYPKWYPVVDPHNEFPNEFLKNSKTVYNLYENYDYHSIYNPSTNYTVMKDNHTGTITYVDISVDNEEFKQFLEKIFISSDEMKLELNIF